MARSIQTDVPVYSTMMCRLVIRRSRCSELGLQNSVFPSVCRTGRGFRALPAQVEAHDPRRVLRTIWHGWRAGGISRPSSEGSRRGSGRNSSWGPPMPVYMDGADASPAFDMPLHQDRRPSRRLILLQGQAKFGLSGRVYSSTTTNS